MRGKTKSFFEDTSIIILVLGSIYGINYLYTNTNNDVDIQKQTKEIIVTKKIEPIVKPQIEIKSKQIVEKKKPIQKEIIVKTIKDEKKVKNVDLKILRAFLIETQYKIRNHIIYSNDLNKTSRFLKLKITILKDGNYEQLTFVDGNKELFDLNKENFVKIFPLTIDEKISDDFPRYFRMTFNK
jgi:hypothetical protein